MTIMQTGGVIEAWGRCADRVGPQATFFLSVPAPAGRFLLGMLSESKTGPEGDA